MTIDRHVILPGYVPDPTTFKPVAGAKIYVGEPDKDPISFPYPLKIQQETGLPVPITQPARTGAGGSPEYAGSPVMLLVETPDVGAYSIKILDENDIQLYYTPNSRELPFKLNFTVLPVSEGGTNFQGPLTGDKIMVSEVVGPVERIIESAVDVSDLILPNGFVGMWSGSIATVPTGWALCDGNNGTPNLTDRFIVHADADSGGIYAPGDTGGENEHTLTISEIPAHDHDVYLRAYGNAGGGGGLFDNGGTRQTSMTGGDQPHENRPPYYALAYIMKL